jgi:hypothetical protein
MGGVCELVPDPASLVLPEELPEDWPSLGDMLLLHAAAKHAGIDRATKVVKKDIRIGLGLSCR